MRYVLLFIVLTMLQNFSAEAQEQNKNLSVRKFERQLHKPGVVVLDVRTEEEFVNGHIPNAQLLDVTKDAFAKNILTFDTSKTYLLYCRSGKRSQKALQILSEAGFKNLYNLEGGYLEWQKKKKKAIAVQSQKGF